MKSFSGNLSNIQIGSDNLFDALGKAIQEEDENLVVQEGNPITEISIKIYKQTLDAPRTGEPYIFFTYDDDGNGPALGFWDGTNLQIIVSLTITDN